MVPEENEKLFTEAHAYSKRKETGANEEETGQTGFNASGRVCAQRNAPTETRERDRQKSEASHRDRPFRSAASGNQSEERTALQAPKQSRQEWEIARREKEIVEL